MRELPYFVKAEIKSKGKTVFSNFAPFLFSKNHKQIWNKTLHQMSSIGNMIVSLAV